MIFLNKLSHLSISNWFLRMLLGIRLELGVAMWRIVGLLVYGLLLGRLLSDAILRRLVISGMECKGFWKKTHLLSLGDGLFDMLS